VDPDASLMRDARDPAAQLGGIQQDVAPRWPVQACLPQRRVDLRLGGGAIKEFE
jgi:hypothetical protein